MPSGWAPLTGGTLGGKLKLKYTEHSAPVITHQEISGFKRYLVEFIRTKKGQIPRATEVTRIMQAVLAAVTPYTTNDWGAPAARADRDLRDHIMASVAEHLQSRTQSVLLIDRLTAPRGATGGFYTYIADIVGSWDRHAWFAGSKTRLCYPDSAMAKSELWQVLAPLHHSAGDEAHEVTYRSRAELDALEYFKREGLEPNGSQTQDREEHSTPRTQEPAMSNLLSTGSNAQTGKSCNFSSGTSSSASSSP